MRRVVSFARSLAVGYAILVALAFVFQRKLVYIPFGGRAELPSRLRPHVHQIACVARDGLITEGWYIPGDKDVTLVQFHGNAGHRGHRLGWALATRKRLGVGVVLTDPRGYGGNDGSPTEEGLYMDGEACLHWAREEIGGNFVLYGESIGGAVAIEVARRAAQSGRPVQGVVLQAAFTSLPDVASTHYPVLPSRLLLWDRFENLKKIRQILAPLLLFHGTKDRIVPYSHGLSLFRRAREPKAMSSIGDAGHNNLVDVAGDEYTAQLRDFIRKEVSMAAHPEPGSHHAAAPGLSTSEEATCLRSGGGDSSGGGGGDKEGDVFYDSDDASGNCASVAA